MRNLTKIFVFSIVYIVLYNLPLVSFKHQGLLNLQALWEIILLIPALFILFATTFLLLPRFLAISFTMLLFVIGGVATYYLVNFGKTLDNGVIIDILSVETELAAEYISLNLVLYIVISLLIPIIIESIFTKYRILISSKIIVGIQLVCLGIFLLHDMGTKLDYKAISLLDHPPIKHFHVTGQFLTKYRLPNNKTKLKADLTKEHKVELKPLSNEPLMVVLVIGESMRGNINALNGYKGHDNMPLLTGWSNLVSFPRARASATSTRVAIPYMLTNAIPPDFEAASNTKGVISIFKHLGFKTSWLGNQGLFNYYDSNYASNALEADYIISKEELRIHLNQTLVHDESLLPYFKERLEMDSGNQFIVVHLIGSHWHFSHRYPESFGHKFMPICNSRAISDCSNEQMLNSYHNTIAYTDFVLDQILKALADKNAILLYASDHGYSLNENGIFGNAYSGPNIPKEQLDIEMFGWMSDKFMQNNKSLYNQMLKNKNRDISHDYIFHSLLDCAGIRADFIDLKLSVCR